jgi:hypothetical protein
MQTEKTAEEIAAIRLKKAIRYMGILESHPPVLQGSEAQVKWATDIRNKYLPIVRANARYHFMRNYNRDGQIVSEVCPATLLGDEGRESLIRLRMMAENHQNADAHFWIDNQYALKNARSIVK